MINLTMQKNKYFVETSPRSGDKNIIENRKRNPKKKPVLNMFLSYTPKKKEEKSFLLSSFFVTYSSCMYFRLMSF